MEIKSRQNPKVKHMKKLAGSRRYRQDCGEIFCDGVKLLKEALKHNLEITCVMSTHNTLDLGGGVEHYYLPPEIIEYISPTDTPQDVVFSCKTPQVRARGASSGIIVLENLQNPGNLGAIIRSADAFNMQMVILLEGCAELYSPKTLRAAMGAVFRQPVVHMSHDELERWLSERGIPLVGAALSEDAAVLGTCDISGAAVAIGSEGSGLSDAILKMCGKRVAIPINAECESLNAAVAASILMWEIWRAERWEEGE